MYNSQQVDTFLELARAFRSKDWNDTIQRAYGKLDKKDKKTIDREAEKIEFQLRGRNIGLNGSRELLAKLGIFLLR